VLGGHVLMYFGSMSSMTPVFKSGKLRGLAVTGNKRHPDFPDMPTFAEAGVPGFEIRLWYGLLAPAGTPRDIVNKVSDIALAAVAQPDFQATLAKQGTDPMPMNPDQFAAFLRIEHARYLDIIKRANVKVEQ
jgi:tripartite-type tricarboxylate transporter receptor subunit TctC